MVKAGFIVLAAGLLLTWIAAQSEAAAEPKAPLVASVTVTGNQALDKDSILGVMQTKPADWKFWQDQPKLDRGRLKSDQESIAQLYRNQGYYEAQVKVEADVRDDLAWVEVKITEGRPVLVRSVSLILVNVAQAWQERLEKEIDRTGLKVGQVFRLEDYRQAKLALVRHLAENGRPKADVKGRAEVSVKGLWAEVFLFVEPGPALKLGAASFSGQQRTRVSVLNREVDWVVGRPFDIRALEKTQRGLMDLGILASARAEPLLDQTEGDLVPVRIAVAEKPRHSVALAVGYGTVDQLRVRVTESNRSLLGRGETISFSAQYSSRILGGQADFSQPHFLAKDQSLNLRAGHEDVDQVGYKNSRSYGRFRLARPLWSDWTGALGYTAEVDRPYDMDGALSWDQSKYYFVSAPMAGLGLDRRDNILDPKRGFQVNLSSEWGATVLGSQVDYLYLESSASQYYTPKSWLTLAGRIKAATVTPLLESGGNIPIFKRLFCGGGNSVRGYPYQKLGPLTAGGKPTGGDSLWEASLEARYPIWKQLRGVVFWDAGQVAASSFSFDPETLRHAVGLGLRYETLIGPLRLDVGYALNQPREATFSPVQFQFSIGQAF